MALNELALALGLGRHDWEGEQPRRGRSKTSSMTLC
jgi:hypothetical protein